MTYYELLHVAPNAPLEVITASYRALMRQAHPDAGGSNERARILNEAYSVLSDPKKRAQYDAQTQQPQFNPFAYPQTPPPFPQQPISAQPMSPADRINAILQRRMMNVLERLADHFEQETLNAFEDPGAGTLYQMPNTNPNRRRRRAG